MNWWMLLDSETDMDLQRESYKMGEKILCKEDVKKRPKVVMQTYWRLTAPVTSSLWKSHL